MDDNITCRITRRTFAVKKLLGRSAAEMIYGTTLSLPGEFTQKYTVDAHTDLDNYSNKLRVAMSRLHLCPLRDTPQFFFFQYKEIETCSHVFLPRITIASLVTAPYDGPYKVIVRSGRVMKILVKGKIDPVALSLRSPIGQEFNRTRIHRYGLPRLKLVRIWPHSIKLTE